MPSNTGKLPIWEASDWNDDGTKHGGELQELGNPPTPGNPPVIPVGHAALTAMPDDAPMNPAYFPTSWAYAGDAPSVASTVGFVRNPT